MRKPLAAGLVWVLLAPACYNAHGIRPSELPRLDGYPARPIEVPDTAGRTITLDRKSKIYLYRVGGDRVGGRFEGIDVRGGRLIGRIDDGQAVDLKLGEIQEVSVDTYSRGQTIAAIVVGSALLVAGIVIALAVSLEQPGYCGRNVCSP